MQNTQKTVEEIEHCNEPNCPECNRVAYERGVKDGREQLKKQIREEIEVKKKKYIDTVGLSDESLSIFNNILSLPLLKVEEDKKE